VRLAADYEARVAVGTAPGWDRLNTPVGEQESLEFILRSAARLREVLARLTDTRPTDHAQEKEGAYA
jgi:hypothetical protein